MTSFELTSVISGVSDNVSLPATMPEKSEGWPADGNGCTTTDSGADTEVNEVEEDDEKLRERMTRVCIPLIVKLIDPLNGTS